MLVPGLSNAKDRDGRTGIAEYSNDGKFVRTAWMPKDAPYGYDARVQPRLNRMLTSSFTGWKNYMRPLGELMGDAEAMKHFGNAMVVWDFHARKPLQTLEVPGAPLEIRWALQPRHDYAFTASALTSKLWLVEAGKDGKFTATAVADIGDPSKTPLPVDISLSADDRFLFVATFMEGKVRVFDVSDPHHPKVVHEQVIGRQVNMVSQTWDGERVYFTSSLLANWDKTGADNEQFLKAYRWDGKKLDAAVRDRLQGREARPPAPHALRTEELLREPDRGGPGHVIAAFVLATAGLLSAAGFRAAAAGRFRARRGHERCPPADGVPLFSRRRVDLPARAKRRESRPPLGHDAVSYTFGVGAFAPQFTPPAPGSYELPPIDTVADHAVVDRRGRRRRCRGDRRTARRRVVHLRHLQRSHRLPDEHRRASSARRSSWRRSLRWRATSRSSR